MLFQEPRVEFVQIDLKDVIATSDCASEYSCDDKVYADVDICSCYNSDSSAVTPIMS